MSAGQSDYRRAVLACAGFGSRGGNRDSSVGVNQHARTGLSLGVRVHRPSVVDLVGGKQATRHAPALIIFGHATVLPK